MILNRNRNKTYGNRSYNSCQIGKRAIKAVCCAIFCFLGTSARHLMLIHHFPATRLFLWLCFKITGNSDCIEEISQKAKQQYDRFYFQWQAEP